MTKTPEELRDYLIAVLNCEGPSAAQDRLALRRQWHHAPEPGPAEQSGPRAVFDRMEDWAGLESQWDRFHDLPADATAELQPWLNSSWRDVRDAAQRMVLLRRHLDRISALWPAALDRMLFDWYLEITLRPPSRRQTRLRALEKALRTARPAQRPFLQFLKRARKEFPEIDFPEPDLTASPNQEPAELRPVAQTVVAQPEESNKSGTTAFWIVIGVAFSLLRIIPEFTSTRKPPPKTQVNNIDWIQPGRQLTAEQIQQSESLQRILKAQHALQNPPASPPLNPHDPLTQAAARSTEILTGVNPLNGATPPVQEPPATKTPPEPSGNPRQPAPKLDPPEVTLQRLRSLLEVRVLQASYDTPELQAAFKRAVGNVVSRSELRVGNMQLKRDIDQLIQEFATQYGPPGQLPARRTIDNDDPPADAASPVGARATEAAP